MTPRETLQRFHEAVDSGQESQMRALMADDVVFRPPTYWKDWGGPDIVARILSHVRQVFEGLTYHREWVDGSDLALEFTGTIDGLDFKGLDLLHLNDDGLIQTFEVVMRPHKTVGLLREKMNARMAEDKDFAAMVAKALEGLADGRA